MENRATEMQHHAPQNSSHGNSYSHHLYPAHHTSHYQQSQNPNPSPQLPSDLLTAPGVDPGASVSSLAHSHGGAVHQAYDPSEAYAHPTAAIDASGYYRDPNAVNSLQNWAADVLRYYGTNPNSTAVAISSNANSRQWNNAMVQPRANSTWKKAFPKKTKVVQSVWCEVCRVECNSKEILDQHKTGKKHQKNMEKLKQAIAPLPVASSGVWVNPVIGPQENPDKGKPAKKNALVTVEDLETKRRKVMEGGAAADAVKTCTVCNVVCNSESVFASHLAGKKHASMMKHHAGGAGVATAT